MRSAVIFGGGGFIGSNYVEQFCGEYDKLVIIDRFHGPSHRTLTHYDQLRCSLRPQDQLFTADAADIRFWPDLLREASHVFILNADTGTGSSYETPSATLEENVVKLAALVEAIRARCDKDRVRILFTSSRAVYGEGRWRCPAHGQQRPDRSASALAGHRFAPVCAECAQLLLLEGSRESDAHQPLSVYGLSKATGEKLLALTLSNAGFDVRIVRYQNVYGVGQAIDNPYTGVLNWFSRALLQGSAVKVYEQGHIVRDFIFVSDAAALLHRLAFADLERTAAGPYIVNGGTGTPTRLFEAALLLKEIYGSRSDVRNTDDFRLGDVLGAVADTARAGDELGYRAQVSLREGLIRYAEWFRRQFPGMR